MSRRRVVMAVGLASMYFGAMAWADVSAPGETKPDKPAAWAESCRQQLLTVREKWNREHPNDLLAPPQVTSQPRNYVDWPNILVSQWFFQTSGSGQAQISWREPWTAKLPDTVHEPVKSVHDDGSVHYAIVRSERATPPSGQWFPAGSRYGTVTGYSERDKQLAELFWPVVERCVRQ